MDYRYAQPPGAPTGIDRFAHDKYLLNQKVLSLGSKYHIYDEMGRELFYVDRPVFKLQAHVGIYEDETRARKLLTLYQDTMLQIINLSFTLLDENEQPIAYMKRDGWMSMLRRTWHIYDTTGREILSAHEDSWWKALARRLPVVDIVGDFLRTNFVLMLPGGRKAGEFIRRYTLTDKYVLDLSADPMRAVDRRVAVALAVLLDNAESR